MRELAARVGMSDVGLKKLLRSYGVSGLPQGHWNRVHAGRPVPAPPAAPARGHATSDRDGNLTTFTVVIGDTRVSLTLDEATKKAVDYNRYDAPRPDPKRSASVPPRLTAGSSTWQDDGSEKLEARIAKISAGLVVEGERAYRAHLRELEEQAERRRIEAERQRQERLPGEPA